MSSLQLFCFVWNMNIIAFVMHQGVRLTVSCISTKHKLIICWFCSVSILAGCACCYAFFLCLYTRARADSTELRGHELWNKNSVSRRIWNRFQYETLGICLLRRQITSKAFLGKRYRLHECMKPLPISDH